jgi:hypothetical protein
MQDKIQPFYNRFFIRWRSLIATSMVPSFSIFWIARCKRRALRAKLFLMLVVARGHRILDVAKAFPDAKFYAFDIS